MKYLTILFSVLLTSLLFIGCSDLKDNIPASAPEIGLHKIGNTNPASPNFHGKVIAGNSWNMNQCQQCHGSNYNGGTAQSSCYNSGCHNTPGGPEACNTCHGDFLNPLLIAPPRSLDGGILPGDKGVGAHTKHLSGNLIGKVVQCTECHTIPNSFADPIHIDKTPGAELVFGDFTKLSTNVPGGFNYQSSLGNFNPNPFFDFASGSCANTYCHGYFKNGNLNNVVAFTAQSQGSACGTCHGDATTHNPLPLNVNQGGTHPENQNCALVFCHGDVVSIDSTTTQIYTFIDKNKHINGKLSFGGTEYTY